MDFMSAVCVSTEETETQALLMRAGLRGFIKEKRGYKLTPTD
jgi:hypothetical protein